MNRARKLNVLFLCTGNSCRSQMAEGFARELKGDVIQAWSAGIVKHGLNRIAVRVMEDIGIDISGQHSKTLTALRGIQFDYVVTVCDGARESCPVFPGAAKRVHHAFDDPPRLAAEAQTDEEALEHYVRVREDIRAFVQSLPLSLEG